VDLAISDLSYPNEEEESNWSNWFFWLIFCFLLTTMWILSYPRAKHSRGTDWLIGHWYDCARIFCHSQKPGRLAWKQKQSAIPKIYIADKQQWACGHWTDTHLPYPDLPPTSQLINYTNLQ
jgi:hypothetical protein